MVLTYTPLHNDNSLNEAAIHEKIDWVIDQGATCIWPGGFAGQWPEMDEDLRKKHFEICYDHAGDRVFCLRDLLLLTTNWSHSLICDLNRFIHLTFIKGRFVQNLL